MADEVQSSVVLSSTSTATLPLVVRTYFPEVVKNDGNIIEAVCSLCKPKKTIIRGQYKAPSNFSKHIQVCMYTISSIALDSIGEARVGRGQLPPCSMPALSNPYIAIGLL